MYSTYHTYSTHRIHFFHYMDSSSALIILALFLSMTFFSFLPYPTTFCLCTLPPSSTLYTPHSIFMYINFFFYSLFPIHLSFSFLLSFLASSLPHLIYPFPLLSLPLSLTSSTQPFHSFSFPHFLTSSSSIPLPSPFSLSPPFLLTSFPFYSPFTLFLSFSLLDMLSSVFVNLASSPPLLLSLTVQKKTC
jgi:hypothetical protein